MSDFDRWQNDAEEHIGFFRLLCYMVAGWAILLFVLLIVAAFSGWL